MLGPDRTHLRVGRELASRGFGLRSGYCRALILCQRHDGTVIETRQRPAPQDREGEQLQQPDPGECSWVERITKRVDWVKVALATATQRKKRARHARSRWLDPTGEAGVVASLRPRQIAQPDRQLGHQ